MTPLIIAKLIAEVGFPLATQLIAAFHSGNAPVAPEAWAALAKLSTYTPDDALAAQGIKIVEGNVVRI